MPGGSSTEQQRTPHTHRHLQSGSPCLAGEQAEGLRASGEGQRQGGSSGERMGEKTKRPGFPRERLRGAPFPAQRQQSPRGSYLAACHGESPSALLSTHRPTTNTSFLPPSASSPTRRPQNPGPGKTTVTPASAQRFPLPSVSLREL